MSLSLEQQMRYTRHLPISRGSLQKQAPVHEYDESVSCVLSFKLVQGSSFGKSFGIPVYLRFLHNIRTNGSSVYLLVLPQKTTFLDLHQKNLFAPTQQ